MRRLMAFIAGPIFLIAAVFVLVTILLSFVVNDLKAGQPAIVHLKNSIANSNVRDGEATKSDKYVTVTSPSHGKEVFAWEQIDYISEKDPTGSRRLDRIVDLIDLLSKFGLVATVLFFIVGLYQYGQTQKWEREKFLAAIVKEFHSSKRARNAKQMLESLAQYPAGRNIDLSESEEAQSRKLISNDQIFSALTTTPSELAGLSDDAVLIRESFDDFLSGLITFCHYVDQNLITKEALTSYIGYWIDLLGPTGKMDPKYKVRVLAYTDEYMGDYVESLIRKYHPKFNWRSLIETKSGP
jgi:hypothetical protein